VNTWHSKPFEALNGAICYGSLLCDERHRSRKKTATPDEMANTAAFMSGSNTNTILRPSWRGMNPQRNAQKETMRVARAATIAEKIAVVMGDIFWSLAVETSDYTF
jgi:hypothetical protein